MIQVMDRAALKLVLLWFRQLWKLRALSARAIIGRGLRYIVSSIYLAMEYERLAALAA